MKTSFEKATHKYLIDGKPATGVTTVISVLAKPALIGWAAKMAVESVKENGEYDGETEEYTISEKLLEEAKGAHTKKKEAAGEAGTDMHALVEQYINICLEINEGRAADLDKSALETFIGIKPFVDWAHENVDHFLFAERQMFDKELFVAGTADFAYIGKDDKKYMADFKTSSGIYGIDYWLQVAAYRMLAEGEGDEQYDGATVVRMGKDGSFEVQQLEEYVLYKEAFLACLTLYRLQGHNKPIIKEKTYK
jgi:hypothetical protein